MAVASIC